MQISRLKPYMDAYTVGETSTHVVPLHGLEEAYNKVYHLMVAERAELEGLRNDKVALIILLILSNAAWLFLHFFRGL